MSTEELKPTDEDVQQFLLSTLRHVFHVEHFLDKLYLGDNDPERPHDIVGLGNKLEWDVIEGLALDYRAPKSKLVKDRIRRSIELHRIQYHHRMWNNPNSVATDDDNKVDAADAVCALSEARIYSGGEHTYEEITKISAHDPPHQIKWMNMMVPEMRRIEQPKLEVIASLTNIPNIGVPSNIYDVICARMQETFRMLVQDYGYVKIR